MTPELKAKWLEDLKSGKYPKTIGHLKDDKGYCCLGVLICTAGYAFNETPSSDSSIGERWYEPKGLVDDHDPLNSGNELSEGARSLFGIEYGQHDDLINLNDEHGTFKEVIEYIEQNL